MERLKKIIRFADKVVNRLFILCFVPMLLYGIYAIWDTAQVDRQAETSVYETYRPTEDELSFAELQKLNPDVFGWLTVYGTNIDYPLVQGKENSTYVNRDVKGNFSLSGSLFLDSRNDKSFQDVNHIIYGHHMEKERMFGGLAAFSDKKYFETHENGALYYDGKWHGITFFAFLHADAYDTVLYNTQICEESDRKSYLSYVKEHAMQYREIPLGADDRYVTLSTCTSDSTNGRHLLVGKITEKPEKDIFKKQNQKHKKGKQERHDTKQRP